MGLGGNLFFNIGSAQAGMVAAQKGFQALSRAAGAVRPQMAKLSASLQQAGQHMNKIRNGVSQAGAGFRSMGQSMAPLTDFWKAGIQEAAKFETQMAAVSAALEPVERASLPAMAEAAKRMASETRYSAVQVAQGFDQMVRAGYSAQDSMVSMPAILRAATAENADMNKVMNAVTTMMKGYGLKAEQTSWAVDILAKASAKTNTDILSLAHSFRYSASQLTQLGIPFEEAAAALSHLSDAGLKGTVAGTSLNAMFKTLLTPSREGAAILDKWGINMGEIMKGEKPLETLLGKIQVGFKGVKNRAQAAAIQGELFGQIGRKASGAFLALDKAKPGGLNELVEALQKASGEAQRMADIRMNTGTAQWERLGNVVKSLQIDLTTGVLNFFKGTMKPISDFVENVRRAFGELTGPMKGAEMHYEKIDRLTKAFGPKVMMVVEGLKQGIETLRGMWAGLLDRLKGVGSWLEEILGPKWPEKIAKWGLVLSVVLGVLAPLATGAAAVAAVFSMAIIPMVVGLGKVLMGVVGVILGPVGIAIGVLIAGFLLFRKENESIMGTFKRLWDIIAYQLTEFWYGTLKPLWDGFAEMITPGLEIAQQAFGELKRALLQIWNDLMKFFSSGSEDASTNWLEVGKTVGFVAGMIISTVAEFLKYFLTGTAFLVAKVIEIGAVIVKWLIDPFKQVIKLVYRIADAFKLVVEGKWKEAAKRVGLALVDFVLSPFRKILQAIMGAAEVMGMQKLIPHFDKLKYLVESDFSDIEFAKYKQPVDGMQKHKAADFKQIQLKAPKVEVTVHNKTDLDGRTLSKSVKKVETDALDRQGAKSVAWQRRMGVSFGGDARAMA
jgi:TP901 family phage tail tape measure protein